MASSTSHAQMFAALRRLTPQAAVSYLQQRGQLTKTFSWRDLWQEEHAQQFTVSRLARLDLLQAVQEAITASVAGDLSRRDFMNDARSLLARAGWWGEKTVIDEADGSPVTTTFDPARLKLIFDTNTRSAYAAGQWDNFARNKRTHPYLRYITAGDGKVRPAHQAWANVTLPVDDPAWATHYPPNGWRCRCRVRAISSRDFGRGVAPDGSPLKTSAPPIEERDWVDDRTGQIRSVPVGIDPGFGYNVGVASARAKSMADQIAAKLGSAAPGLAAAARSAGLTPPKATP